jgi:hypothetical protein
MKPRRVVSAALVVAAVLLAAAAASAAGRAEADKQCLHSRGKGSAIATVLQLVSTTAHVGGKFVGAAPFAIRDGDSVCTDARGQVVFALTGVRGTACITLPMSSVLAAPRLSFVRGASWCVTRGTQPEYFVGATKVVAGKGSLFGVSDVSGKTVVKVLAGWVETPGARVTRSEQVTVGSKTTRDATLSADDRRAIAQLSAALAKST